MNIRIKQYAQDLGVSSDGCQTRADVKNRAQMLEQIEFGILGKKLINPFRLWALQE